MAVELFQNSVPQRAVSDVPVLESQAFQAG
jgi:hypothetical protein